MKFTINIKKLHFVILLFVIIVVGVVWAQQQTLPTPNPGHNSGEILVRAITQPGHPTFINQTLESWLGWLGGKVLDNSQDITALDVRVDVLEAPTTCPSGMNPVGDFCIDIVRTDPAGRDYSTAIAYCRNQGKHLCSGREWVAACFSSGGGTSWGGPWGGTGVYGGEWAGDVVDSINVGNPSITVSVAAAYRSQAPSSGSSLGTTCPTASFHRIDNINIPFRCCKNKI